MDRQEILQELQRRIRAGGGRLTTTVKSLAEEWNEKTERLYYLIRGFEREGAIATVSHGPKGMEFLPGSGVPQAPGGNGARGGRRAGGVVRRGRAANAAIAVSRFCPWCGAAVRSEWRYCGACGHELPRVR